LYRRDWYELVVKLSAGLPMADSNDDLIRRIKETRSEAESQLPLRASTNLTLLRDPILGLLRDSEKEGLVSRVDEFYVSGGIGLLCLVDDKPLFVIHHTGAADERGEGNIKAWKASPDGSPVGAPIWNRPYSIQPTPKLQLDHQQVIRNHIKNWIAAKKLPDKL